MAAQRFSRELSDLPEQLNRAGLVLRRKHDHHPTRSLSRLCVKCGRHEAEAMNLCGECGGSRDVGWRSYRPEMAGDPPFYGANWVPIEVISLRKVGR